MRQLGLCTAPAHNIRRSAHNTISCATTRTAHKGTYTKAKTKALHSAARCRQTAQQPRHNTASTQTHPQHSKRLKRSSTKHTVGAAATQSGTTPGWQSRLRRGHLRPRETLPSANIAPRDKAQRHRSRGARGAGAPPPAPAARLSHQKFQQHNSYQVRASEGVFYTQLGFQFCFIIKNTSPISELFRI